MATHYKNQKVPEPDLKKCRRSLEKAGKLQRAQEYKESYHYCDKALNYYSEEFPEELYYNIIDIKGLCGYYLGHYKESYDLSEKIINDRDHLLTPYDKQRIRVNMNFARKLLLREKVEENKGLLKDVAITITTCKRIQLFHKTMKSFLEKCPDAKQIDRWYCIDDGSSDRDIQEMRTSYPFLTIICKSKEMKGHPSSVSLIPKLCSDCEYVYHLEDDFQFIKSFTIKGLIEIAKKHSLDEIICTDRCGHHNLLESEPNNIYEYDPYYSPIKWPGFSLNPSLMSKTLFKDFPLDPKTPDFEHDMATKYRNRGMKIAFSDICRHIGQEMSAYKLNDEHRRYESPEICLTITSCKRLDLFRRTVNSFRKFCHDRQKINEWICIDDNSLEEDRLKMQKEFPFFTFIFKSENQKGHMKSMNMLREYVLSRGYKYCVHLEDDWEFQETVPLDFCVEILEENPQYGQVLFNKNYMERSSQVVHGGIVKLTESGKNFLEHEHLTPEQMRNVRALSNGYWKHYSLRPHVLRTEVHEQLGPYQEWTGTRQGNFETEYSERYMKNGYKSAFLNGFKCEHIGPATFEDEPNAYKLNGVNQWS